MKMKKYYTVLNTQYMSYDSTKASVVKRINNKQLGGCVEGKVFEDIQDSNIFYLCLLIGC
jgi:hypothetical protein